MTEWNEQQEQEMIEKAKAGDPEANYQMSLWALDQAMAEPEEDRWNRLAAKCLVKAAEAGYAPAKAKMDELLQAAEAKNAQAAAVSRPAARRPDAKVTPDEPMTAAITSEQLGKVAGQAGEAAKKAGKAAGKAAAKAGSAIASGASSLAKRAKAGIAKASEARAAAAEARAAEQEAKAAEQAAKAAEAGADSVDAQEEAPGGSHTRKKSSILPDFSQWDDAKWKKMQIICIVVCVVLALLIAALIISANRRKNRAAQEEPTIQIPVAEVAATPGPTNAPAPAEGTEEDGEETAAPAEDAENAGAENPGAEPAESTPAAEPAGDYPDQATKDEIQAASLDVYPEDADYVDGPKTVTVSTQGSALNMRRGPGANYSLVNAMPNGTQVSVYANKNGWGLVNYDGTWGWCSYDYLNS